MQSWKTSMQRGIVSGTTSSVLSTLALAATGHGETGSVFAPTNAISHWLWGERAMRRDGPSLRYTLVGYVIHHCSATFWAVLYERCLGDRLARGDPLLALQTAAATSALASLVDYQLIPRRVNPGFEQRLSRPSLALVYGAFGLGLAAGALLCRRR